MGALGRLWKKILGNVFTTLALLLGVMQVAVGHWAVVVVAGREGPGLAVGSLLAAVLVAANYLLMPVLRRARRGTGWARPVANLYMSVGVATLLLGAAVTFSFLGWLPLGALLSWVGVGPETVFGLFRIASGAIVGSIAAMLLWGFTVGQSQLDHTHLHVPLPDLADEHAGLRILQLSDLHIGNGMEGERLSRLIEHVNEREPDLIALTGDLFDFDPSFVEDGCRRLGELRARLGVFAVLGNHDVYTGTEVVADGFARHAPSVRLLRGDVVRLETDAPLYIAGLDDPSGVWTARGLEIPELTALAENVPTDGNTVLLVHRPELFPQAARLGFPLVLAGHTHGGQLALPLAGGRHNMARLITRFARGLYTEAGSLLYVNRGVGVAGPAVRVNCPREVATLELQRASEGFGGLS
ncbi:MAG: metallophosphoesterase [Myxococcales bacterium]|nr:metallophosphoesterase [Myxococcales bacterium]